MKSAIGGILGGCASSIVVCAANQAITALNINLLLISIWATGAMSFLLCTIMYYFKIVEKTHDDGTIYNYPFGIGLFIGTILTTYHIMLHAP